MDEVRKRSKQVEAMGEDWPMIDALMGGTSAMRKAGRVFLPPWPREDGDSYNSRLSTATLFPAYSRTVSILVGKPFGKPVVIGDDIPPQIVALLEDVDREHRNLHSFCAAVAADVLSHGFCGILVDCPPNPGARSVRDEREAGIRPYFVHIRPGNILGWRTAQIGGRQLLTQLRLLETIEEPEGQFAVVSVEQVRVLEPGLWQIWRKLRDPTTNRETWVVYDQGLTSLDAIPFVPLYGQRQSYMRGVAPMLELAHSNVEHWQSKSDQQTIVHAVRAPIIFARGLGDAEIVVGPHSFISTGSETADIKYVEHSGKAIEAGRLSLLDLEDRMRQAGAELLVIKPGNTTTVQVMSDNEQAKCDLQRMAEVLEDGLDQALDFMAAWLGLGEDAGGHAHVFKDFGAASLAEASQTMLFGMQQAGALSHETLLNELKRRGTLAPEVDVQAEIVAALAEAAARAAVIAEQERISA